MWIFALILIFLAFCLMVWFKDYGDGVSNLVNKNKVCPADGVDPVKALEDYYKHPKQRGGHFSCFCLDLNNNGELDSAAEKL